MQGAGLLGCSSLFPIGPVTGAAKNRSGQYQETSAPWLSILRSRDEGSVGRVAVTLGWIRLRS